MTEYRLQCRQADSDYLTAQRSVYGDAIRIYGFQNGDDVMYVHANPTDARTFARGIMALADEIDGGEKTPAVDEPLKVGDRVVVVKDDPEGRTGEFVGLVGTLKYVNDYDPYDTIPYLVGFGDDTGSHGDRINGRWYCAEVKRVDDAPTVTVPGPADEPLKVGDRVVIVREYQGIKSDYDGANGDVVALDLGDEYPYKVRTGTGHLPDGVWVHEIRRVTDSEPDSPASVSDPRRLAALEEARKLTGFDVVDEDTITVARFLLGE